VLEALKAADVDDRVGSAATTIYQALIEAELTAVIGAGPHERTETRTAQRNGPRPRPKRNATSPLHCSGGRNRCPDRRQPQRGHLGV
jgi:transposase-like protein